jgi:resuscitation-promoting factor RpfA
MRTDRSAARALTLAAVDAVAVWRLWPDLTALRHDLAHPQAWVDRVGGDNASFALAAAALWLVGLWLAVGLSAALVSNAPGALGAVARRFARFALPQVLYRTAAGAAGLGVLLTPITAGAQTPHHGAYQPPLPTPTLPTSSIPAPTLPASVLPESPAPLPALHQNLATDVVVRPGDSLWSVAAAHLAPGASATRVAASWPRWYTANRAQIGSDPDHITPGQVLHAPSEQEMP